MFFLVPSHPGSPGQRAVCVCCVSVILSSTYFCCFVFYLTFIQSVPLVVILTSDIDCCSGFVCRFLCIEALLSNSIICRGV